MRKKNANLADLNTNSNDLGMNEFPSLKGKSIDKLNALAQTIRTRIIEVLSKNGGHLSSNLGAVEITIAMHAVFDYTRDPFIFDVSHQIYAHKLLTGRFGAFATLRQTNGISGFAKPSESNADYFIAGHSSTSLSLGVGAARAFKLRGEDRMPIILIGDGAMSAGLIYEALDEIGDIKYPMIIVLNDNEMSISKPIGAMSKYLSTATAGRVYQGMREKIKGFLSKMPDSATFMAKRFEESLKLITPGILFEELGLNYIGPIDGHNIAELIRIFQKARELKKPVLIHAQTIKGYGYQIAQGRYEKWHSVSPFDIATGLPISAPKPTNPTKIFAQKLLELAKKDDKIVGVTAAMPSGTGLDLLMDNLPNRFFDVAIAEAHATTSMAAMAKEGFKPFVVVYSTFLQRAFDSIIHDVSIMNLPVRFALDRAGIVGEDGETHQGIFDISYLSLIPNMVIFAPRDDRSLELAVAFAADFDKSPCAFRYPRGGFLLKNNTFKNRKFRLGKGEILHEGSGFAIGDSHNAQNCRIEQNEISQNFNDLTPSPSPIQTHFTFGEGESLDSLGVAQTHGLFAKQKVRKKTLDFGISHESQESSSSTQLWGSKGATPPCQKSFPRRGETLFSPSPVGRGLGGGAKSQNNETLQDSFESCESTPQNRIKITFLAFGNALGRAHLVNEILDFRATLVDLRFAKPLDSALIAQIAQENDKLYIFSDGVKKGGIAQNIALLLSEKAIFVPIYSFEFDDKFIPQGKTAEIEDILGISPKKIARFIKKDLRSLLRDSTPTQTRKSKKTK